MKNSAGNKKYAVMVGNPVDGFSLYGPFNIMDLAIEWGVANLDGDWWVSELFSSEEK